MFTGIIEAISPIISLNDRGGKRYLKLQRPPSFENIKEETASPATASASP